VSLKQSVAAEWRKTEGFQRELHGSQMEGAFNIPCPSYLNNTVTSAFFQEGMCFLVSAKQRFPHFCDFFDVFYLKGNPCF
jgi:hypothetical protein